MDLFSEFFNDIWNEFDMMGSVPVQREEKSCKNCGLTMTEFKKTGKFGCSECYNTFRTIADNSLKQIHSNSIHTGKIPSKSGSELRLKRQIDELKNKLAAAVKNEDYEAAAKLHKEIKQLEAK